MKSKKYLIGIFITLMFLMPLSAPSANGISNVDKIIQTVHSKGVKAVDSVQKHTQIPTKANDYNVYKNTVKQDSESRVFFYLAIKMLKALVAVVVLIIVLFGLIKIVKGKQKIPVSTVDFSNKKELDLTTPKTVSGAVANFVKKNF